MPKKDKKLSKKKLTKNSLFGFGLLLLLILAVVIYKETQPPQTPVLEKPTLKELASPKGVALGNHAIHNHLQDKAYTDILKSEFDYVLADNTPNWYFTDGGLRPTKDTYNFKQMDEIIDFAEANSKFVEAHHYVWGEEKWLPTWLKEGNYSPEELQTILKDHIQTVGKNYAGKVDIWTVVNEAFTREQGLFALRDWWADNTGELGYIDQSFKWAREADPKSKLLINDFNNEAINETSNVMYDYIKDALKRGVPIDGIGMQMHLDGVHPPTKDEVIANMNRFSALGIGVYVTEFDVNMNDVKADGADKDRIQENIYYEMMRACLEADNCKHFAYLGITDSETWYNHIGLKDPRPLMFDKNYNPKPAYWGVRTALQQKD